MMLTGREVSVAIGKTPILHAVDFEARAGHLTAIVGPNGSGKTTLLRALCGEVAYSGSVSINGVDVRDQKPWELAAIRGVLPQATALAFPKQFRPSGK
ncbi:MAG: ATP-binding cassette domain-containing protein [Pseudomonadota bacterium]